MEIVDLLKTVSELKQTFFCLKFNLRFIFSQKTPIKGPIHNYDPHNFDDVYADEYGGYGSGMNTGNFRNGGGGGGARFGNDRGLIRRSLVFNKVFLTINFSRFRWKPF